MQGPNNGLDEYMIHSYLTKKGLKQMQKLRIYVIGRYLIFIRCLINIGFELALRSELLYLVVLLVNLFIVST